MTLTQMTRRVVLNLGAGHAPFPIPDVYPPEEWEEVRVDADPDAVADVRADLTDLPFEDGFADAIVCVGVLEHFVEPQVPLVLAEMWRVLVLGGELKLLVPDLVAVAQAVVDGRLLDPLIESPSGNIRALDILYGFSPMLAEHPLWGHRTGFTSDSLAATLGSVGFGGSVFTDPTLAPFMLMADVAKQ